ncbi:MAG: hypothetical protein MR009_05115 [Sutterellaceae bacterium]|nr:hypothetical protein [Sutterellaceae bacterium]MDD7441833.1 hypothetical protein [Sutterellaceae bacterium]MDY2867683.1 hypothetical protein [Mesosutterella sp.]
MRYRLVLCSFAAAVLAGCASSSPDPAPAEPHAATVRQDQPAQPAKAPRRKGALPPASLISEPTDPLIDAPYRTLIRCDAEEPLVAGEKFGDVRLLCHSLRVTATITEFRDAGWRIEEIRMSESKTPEGAFAIPFSVSLRKLF